MTHKVCTKCNEERPLDCFHKNKSNPDGLSYHCKACTYLRSSEWHTKNKQKRNKQLSERSRQRKREAVEAFGNKCHDCGKGFPDCCFDFHHLDSDSKDLNPSAVLRLSKERRETELEKCVLLCANCHRIRHHDNTIS